MAVPTVRRNPVTALDPNIKGGNYLNNILAVTEARELGADDCVILDHNGLVTEASNSNVWFVIDGRLLTPASGNLRGLTKKALHSALKEAGMASEETDIHADRLAQAGEGFVTSATREVMPIRSLRLEDGNVVEFPEGGGDVTRRTAAVFKAYIDRYVREHADEALF
jgi:branched-chain amino acid aminotransferase